MNQFNDRGLTLGRLKKIINEAIEYGKTEDSVIEFWLDDEILDIESIGQFHFVPDLSVKLIRAE